MDEVEGILNPTPIADVFWQPLREIPTDGGPVLHMYRPGSPICAHLAREGKICAEVYFSEVLPGAVKAWKRHRLQQQVFAVPVGRLKIVLYDDRKDSPSCGTSAEFILGRPDNYALLTFPPLIWYGFTALGSTPALLCNCPDRPHDPAESDRLPKENDYIPYRFAPTTPA